MGPQFSTWAFALTISFLLFAHPSPTLSFYHPGYSYDTKSGYYSPQWMLQIKDEAKLSDLSIPGTHASFFTENGGLYQTQSMSFHTQFFSGIRFFDVGCVDQGRELNLFHGQYNLHINLDSVFTSIEDILTHYPSETIILHIYKTSGIHSQAFTSCLKEHIERHIEIIWDSKEATIYNPTLGDIRGKIVILHNIASLVDGINYQQNFTIQKGNFFSTNWQLYSKWLEVKQTMIEANYYSFSGKKKDFFINFLAGWGNSYPFFVASGHLSYDTHGSQLSTTLTTPLFDSSYPEFPRTSCWGYLCTISFMGTNMLATDYIQNNPFLVYVGIIVADFPGPGLIDSIIAVNRVLSKPGYNAGQYFTIIPSHGTDFAFDLNVSNNAAIVWKYHGGTNQGFIFDLLQQIRPTYLIRSMHNKQLVLTWDPSITENNLYFSRYVGLVTQHWSFEYVEGFEFIIRPYQDPEMAIQLPDFDLEDGQSLTVSTLAETTTYQLYRYLFLLKTINI